MDTTPDPEPTQSDQLQPDLSTTKPNPEERRKLVIIIAIVAGAVILCCAAILCIGAIYLLTRGNSSASAPKPPHYGVFIQKGGKLVELDENQFFGLPDESELQNLVTVADKKPAILVWRRETVLQYLQFFSISDRDELSYDATPRENGVIEIQPKTNLSKGIYCLVQGNPLASGLPGWCFEIK